MTSRGKRVLVGCGVGCGGLIVLAIVAAVGFAVWINRPGELLEPTRLLGRDTTGYAEWTLRLEDRGTEGFVRLLIQRLQDLPPDTAGALPPLIENWLDERRRRETREDIEALFPLVLAWTLHPGGADGQGSHLITASARSMGNQLVFADWVLGFALGRADSALVHRHRDERIYQFGDEDETIVTFFLRGNDVFLTSNLDTARRAVDRLTTSAERDRDPSELERLFGRTREPDTLRAALTNRTGEILQVLDTLGADVEAPEDWRSVHGAVITGGLQEDGTLRADIALTGPDPAWAEARAGALGESLRHLLERSPLRSEVTSAANGDRIHIEVRIPDLVASLTGWVEEN